MPLLTFPTTKNSVAMDYVMKRNLFPTNLNVEKQNWQKMNAFKQKPKVAPLRKTKTLKTAGITVEHIKQAFEPEKCWFDEEPYHLFTTTKPSHTALAGGVISVPVNHHSKFMHAYAKDVVEDIKCRFESKVNFIHGQHTWSEFGHKEAFPLFFDGDLFFDGEFAPILTDTSNQDILYLFVRISQIVARRYFASTSDKSWQRIGSVAVTQTLPRRIDKVLPFEESVEPSREKTLLFTPGELTQSLSLGCNDFAPSLNQSTGILTPSILSENSSTVLDLPSNDSLESTSSTVRQPSPEPSSTLTTSQIITPSFKYPDTVSIGDLLKTVPSKWRHKVGIHIHFYNLIVDVKTAKVIREAIIAELVNQLNFRQSIRNLTSLCLWGPFDTATYSSATRDLAQMVWGAMIDEQVFEPEPHCKMFGSHKTTRKLCSTCRINPKLSKTMQCNECHQGRNRTEGEAAMGDLVYLLQGDGTCDPEERLQQLVVESYAKSSLLRNIQDNPLVLWSGLDSHPRVEINSVVTPFQRFKMACADDDDLLNYVRFVLGKTSIRLPIDPITSIWSDHLTPGFEIPESLQDLHAAPKVSAIPEPSSKELGKTACVLVNPNCETALVSAIRQLRPEWNYLSFEPFIRISNKEKLWRVAASGIGVHYCTLAGRYHNSSKIKFEITPLGIRQICYSESRRGLAQCCNDRRGEWHTLPTIGYQILFPQHRHIDPNTLQANPFDSTSPPPSKKKMTARDVALMGK